MSTAAEHYWGSEHNFTGAGLIDEVWAERKRQLDKWGPQTHPDGTEASALSIAMRDQAKEICDQANAEGTATWAMILGEEVLEAFAESDQAKLRTELVQSAAVIAAWIEDIDARSQVHAGLEYIQQVYGKDGARG